MSEFSDINENNSNTNPLPQINSIISEENKLQEIEAVLSENNDLINLEQTQEIKQTNLITKEHNKSSENEPLTFHESSEVIQVPIIDSKPNSFESPSTLDEAILTTILRDLSLIYTKLKFVVIPYGSKDKKSYHIKQ